MSEHSTKEKILEASKEIFNEVGISKATMNIVADKTGYARRTIYRYFESKEDIAYKVMLTYMEEWNRAQKYMYEDLSGNGLNKLEEHLLRLLTYMEENLNIMKFMSDFDYYFRDSKKYKLDEQMGVEVNKTYHLCDTLFENLINEGIVDGSIDLKDQLDMVVATITNVLWVFGQAIALRGEHIGLDAGIEAVDMFRCQIRLYVEALKSDEC